MSIAPISISLDFIILFTNEISSIGVTPFVLPILTDKLEKSVLLLDLSLNGFLSSLLFSLFVSLLTSL